MNGWLSSAPSWAKFLFLISLFMWKKEEQPRIGPVLGARYWGYSRDKYE